VLRIEPAGAVLAPGRSSLTGAMADFGQKLPIATSASTFQIDSKREALLGGECKRRS